MRPRQPLGYKVGNLLNDIRLEKFLELFYDHLRANLDCELKDTCPALREFG
jgi:hypothetical protein